jgi:hypothetical protein
VAILYLLYAVSSSFFGFLDEFQVNSLAGISFMISKEILMSYSRKFLDAVGARAPRIRRAKRAIVVADPYKRS